MKKLAWPFLWVFTAIFCVWIVYYQSPGVSEARRDARYKVEQAKVSQEAQARYSELEKLDKIHALLIQEKATQFVRLSNENKIFLGNEDRVQVPIESAPEVAQAIITAEASYWVDQLKKSDGSEIKMFFILQTYQYVTLSGQGFDKFGLSEDFLNSQYQALAAAWEEEHKNDGPGNIAMPAFVFVCPIYTITFGNEPIKVSGDPLTKLVAEIAKSYKKSQ